MTPRSVSGRVWRQGAPDRGLLETPPRTRRPGRYHRKGGPGAWYASTKERAAWSEHFRHHPRGGVDPFEVRRCVGRARVEDLRVLDLTDEEVRDILGVKANDLTGDDYAKCQDVADRARAAGFDGILAPSAALRGEFTVVVFTHAMSRLVEEHSRIQRPPRTMRKYVRRIPRRLG